MWRRHPKRSHDTAWKNGVGLSRINISYLLMCSPGRLSIHATLTEGASVQGALKPIPYYIYDENKWNPLFATWCPQTPSWALNATFNYYHPTDQDQSSEYFSRLRIMAIHDGNSLSSLFSSAKSILRHWILAPPFPLPLWQPYLQEMRLLIYDTHYYNSSWYFLHKITLDSMIHYKSWYILQVWKCRCFRTSTSRKNSNNDLGTKHSSCHTTRCTMPGKSIQT